VNTKRIFLQDHKSIDFQFNQNRYDFVVDEITNREFSNSGNFLILHLKKEYLSTWDLLKTISKKLDIEEHKIGYAGLKDKNATTTQYISIPLMKEKALKVLNNKQITLLGVYRDNKKLNIGDLAGNRFKITLKEIKPEDITILYQVISQIQKHGMPNYFGFQRFGEEYNFDKAKAVVYGEEIVRNKNLEHLLISAYQSYFFNAWLSKRVQIAKELNLKRLNILDGDIFSDKTKKTITGLLPGRKVVRSKSQAREIEKEFDDEFVYAKGFRREAWIKPLDIKNKYIKEENQLILEFTLPKGSYATVFIENLANKNFK